jgi:hypothetical protein
MLNKRCLQIWLAQKKYIQQFTAAEITDESFDTDLNAYFFTVPAGTSFDLLSGFCGNETGAQEIQFIDEFGLVVYMLSSAFQRNTTDNVVKNTFFDGASCFEACSGNNKLTNVQVVGNYFFKECQGNNIFINLDVTSNDAFDSSTGSNKFYRLLSKGDYSFSGILGNNEFYNCEFAKFNFANSTGVNIFYGSTLFQSSCFYTSLSDNFFYGNVTAEADFFYEAQSGNNFFYKDLTVGNSAFDNAKSNNFINKIVSAGNNLFRVAAPKNKNEIVELVSCGDNAFRDYVGSIYFSILGEDNTQNLPANIFTVTTECCVNFNFSLKAYNDGDYVQMVANIGLNPAPHQINLF